MTLIHFHAVMIDETGCEFGAGVDANSRDEAHEMLQERYPESRIAQLESPEDTARREAAIYARISAEYEDDFYFDEEDY